MLSSYSSDELYKLLHDAEALPPNVLVYVAAEALRRHLLKEKVNGEDN